MARTEERQAPSPRPPPWLGRRNGTMVEMGGMTAMFES
jgi:hypothetical protein